MLFELPDNLTEEQKNLINIDLDDPWRKWWWENLVVQWFAWTWKTVVAYYRAIKAVKEWKNILILCFWKVLRQLLRSEKSQHLQCIFHADWLYSDIKKDINKSSNTEAKVMLSEESKWFKWLPNLSLQKKDFLIKVIKAYKKVHWLSEDEKLYDEIIIDEWQDLSRDFLESLKELSSHVSIFADDNQWIFDKAKTTTVDIMKEIFSPDNDVEYLTQNFRTTKQICQFAAEKFLPENEKLRAIKESSTCRDDPKSVPQIYWPNSYAKVWLEKFFAAFVKKQLWNVIDEATWDTIKNILIVAPSQTAVEYISVMLSDAEQEHSIYHSNLDELFKKKSPYCDFDLTWKGDWILVTTYHSSKWLEADCVFIYLTKDEFEKSKDERKKIFYVLSTRAKRRLYLITDFQF